MVSFTNSGLLQSLGSVEHQTVNTSSNPITPNESTEYRQTLNFTSRSLKKEQSLN